MTYEEIVSLLDDSANAVKPDPGKFEGTTDARIATALYSMTLDSLTDDSFGSSAEGTWYGLIGRFVVWEDEQGFFGYEHFDSEAEAKEHFLAEAAEFHNLF